jgi:hypothetical protein
MIIQKQLALGTPITEEHSWTHAEIKEHFFDDVKVWINLNQLVLEMQRFVLNHPDYLAVN